MMKLRKYELRSSLLSVLGVFWVDSPFVVIGGYKRFGGGHCLSFQVRNIAYLLTLSLASLHSSDVLCPFIIQRMENGPLNLLTPSGYFPYRQV